MSAASSRLGLMGGTFDPIHLGHLRAAEEIAELFNLEAVYFIPAAFPPHKPQFPLAGYQHRFNMLKLALGQRPGFYASDIESRFAGPSYTANTLDYFKKNMGPAVKLFFLIGLDAFLNVHKWYNFKELFQSAAFVVFHRSGLKGGLKNVAELLAAKVDSAYVWRKETESFSAPGLEDVYYRPGCRLEISSTDVRRRLCLGSSVRYLVPEAVLNYIYENNLYHDSKNN